MTSIITCTLLLIGMIIVTIVMVGVLVVILIREHKNGKDVNNI
jgi:hypothetical protein